MNLSHTLKMGFLVPFRGSFPNFRMTWESPASLCQTLSFCSSAPLWDIHPFIVCSIDRSLTHSLNHLFVMFVHSFICSFIHFTGCCDWCKWWKRYRENIWREVWNWMHKVHQMRCLCWERFERLSVYAYMYIKPNRHCTWTEGSTWSVHYKIQRLHVL